MVIDMTVVWIFDNLACLIPITDETANINAVGKPFQWPVCIKAHVIISYAIKYYPACNAHQGLVRTRHINDLRHRHLEFNATLFGISIDI
jgi:hypothetical protein